MQAFGKCPYQVFGGVARGRGERAFGFGQIVMAILACVARSSEQLQRRLAELDQQAASLRDHFRTLDAATAQGLGLYDEAMRVTDKRKRVEHDIGLLPAARP